MPLLHAFKELTRRQFEAALATLNACVGRCPDELWNARGGNLAFCQVTFHALFYADYYLGRSGDEASFRAQPFHRDHADFFGDYEEFQDRQPTMRYARPGILEYVQHCRARAAEAIAAETEQTLSGWCGFQGRPLTRAELYVYNIRHLQHHAAQLSLRLRLDAGQEVPWIGYGWRDVS